MANSESHWSVKYRDTVNSTKGISAEEPSSPSGKKKMKTKMAFQSTLDSVRDKENEPEKTSDKKLDKSSDSKKIGSRV